MGKASKIKGKHSKSAILGINLPEGRVTRPIGQFDEFGLPQLMRMHQTKEEIRGRQERARTQGKKILNHVFRNLMFNLGPVEARQIFKEISRLPPHRRRGSANIARNEILLSEYRRLANTTANPSTIPRLIAEKIHREAPGQFGNSATAIEKQIRRLIRNENWISERAQLMGNELGQIAKQLSTEKTPNSRRKRQSKRPKPAL